MTTVSTVTTRGTLAATLSHLIRLFRAWRRDETSLYELSYLGDRQLADMGIVRSDIPHLTRAPVRIF
jgi:uncharacterized protein YjiS (DUF1127 family)